MNHIKSLENLEKCPHYSSCSRNLCPLYFNLKFKCKNDADKCRWMKEPKKKKIKRREFMAGGGVMPNGILMCVPESNLGWLNEASKKRWPVLQENREQKKVKNH